MDVNLVAFESLSDSYEVHHRIPWRFTKLLKISSSSETCCYNWCEKREACVGFIFDSKDQSCTLLNYLNGMRKGLKLPGKITAVRKSYIGKGKEY